MGSNQDIQSTVLVNETPTLFEEIRLLDDRIPVARPDVFPSRCVGHIEIKLRGGGGYTASGSLVSDYTVLTAGHVVKNASNQFHDIQSFRFIPGRNRAAMPYGVYEYSEMRAVNAGHSRDWALISLTQAAGFRTGFLGTLAKFPVDRWTREGDRFAHVGFPGDHRDEMWVDEDGACTGIYEGRQLITDIDAAHGQSGGPLAIQWFSGDPRVCGCLSWGPNAAEDPNYFTPGFEDVKTDVWMQWLCDHFGHLHSDDRFGKSNTALFAADDMGTVGMLPNYELPHSFIEDTGPDVRRFSSRFTTDLLTPNRVRINAAKAKR
ncbi:MAG: trypsin-like serine protease [Desulfomonile tiedjei]|uniref:Serine protease n=1 Tax=Desulfomonile tiedjei TaxID=2358 RepID=A0A9D6Z262_9BACT|nr:trypsin-like serine protease [Desulfomonile tiedjei]